MDRKPFLIMGILNATPDSFSDGGQFLDPASAFRQAQTLMEQGADIIDIGAESTRPGAIPIHVETEWERLEPILKSLKSRPSEILLSIDTYKPEIMRRAMDYGVEMINDIEGTADEAFLAALTAEFPNLNYIAMHKHGSPQDMQTRPLTETAPVETALQGFHQRLLHCGFLPENIWVDPGIGFGKTDQVNWHLLSACTNWARTMQVAVGVSRKGFIGRWLGIENPVQRDEASKALEAGLIMNGVSLVRTHNIGPLTELRKLMRGYVH